MIKPALLTKALDSVIDTALIEKKVFGTTVIILQDGKPCYTRTAGNINRTTQTPLHENALYRYASISKAFTSVAIMALAEQNKLSLDDSVTQWLPYFTPRLPDGRPPTITLKQLMTHTAGLDYRWAQTTAGLYAQAGSSAGLDI